MLIKIQMLYTQKSVDVHLLTMFAGTHWSTQGAHCGLTYCAQRSYNSSWCPIDGVNNQLAPVHHSILHDTLSHLL